MSHVAIAGMETPQTKQLLRDLERAMASEAALKQQRADMIKTVARSPKKKIRQPRGPNVNGLKTEKAKSMPPPVSRSHVCHGTIPAVHRPEPPVPNPQSPTTSQDTVGREIDAAIAKSVADMLQTPEPVRGPRIVPVPTAGTIGGNSPLSPQYFTSKRRNMHCELDEPGLGVPYPRPSSARRGFFARLFSCFAPPSVYRPPMGPPLPRPASAKVTPPTLKLKSEMEPLRQSLAILKPELLSGTVGELDSKTDICCEFNDERALRRSLTRSVAAVVASDPPTPMFGGIAGEAWRQRDTTHYSEDFELDSEDSFESLEAELSEGGNTPEPPVRRGRAPAPVQQQKRQRQRKEMNNTEEAVDTARAHANMIYEALIKASSSSQGQTQQAVPVPAAPPVKTTHVSVATLIGQPGGKLGRPHAIQKDSSTQRILSGQQRAPRTAAPRSAPASPPPKKRGVSHPTDHHEAKMTQSHRPKAASAPVSRAVSPLRQPAIQPRMTKAAAARSLATQRLLETRRQREIAHLSAVSAAGKSNPCNRHHVGRSGAVQCMHSTRDVVQDTSQAGFILPPAGSGLGGVFPSCSESATMSDNKVPVSGGSSPRFSNMLDRLAMGMSVDLDLVNAAKKPLSPPGRLPALYLEASRGGGEGTVTNGDLQIGPNSNTHSSTGGNDGREALKTNQVFDGPVTAVEKTAAAPSPMLVSQKLVSIHDVARGRSESSAKVSEDQNNVCMVDIDVDASSNTLLQQLLDLQRSLSLQDLDALKQAIRRDADQTVQGMEAS